MSRAVARIRDWIARDWARLSRGEVVFLQWVIALTASLTGLYLILLSLAGRAN